MVCRRGKKRDEACLSVFVGAASRVRAQDMPYAARRKRHKMTQLQKKVMLWSVLILSTNE